MITARELFVKQGCRSRCCFDPAVMYNPGQQNSLDLFRLAYCQRPPGHGYP